MRRRPGRLALWDVIPFDWINDSDTAATRYVLIRIKPGSVVLLRTILLDRRSGAAFMPMLKANGYHLVTVSQLLGDRAPGSVYGDGEPFPRHSGRGYSRAAGHPVAGTDAELPDHRHPGANSGGPNNGV